ncbi:MAG TPA: DHHA1 domain-containing protein [Phycisphaerae bacterium]|nr:DHHA1 domain-containing protein [Phycisphaerae bacterium]
MCAKSADESLAAVAARLASAGRLVFVCHARPDGDTLGCAAAMTRAARAAGKGARTVLSDRLPAQYAWLFGAESPAPPAEFDALADAADAVVILDTCARAQLDALGGALGRVGPKLLVLDHHATRDDLGAARWIDTSAAATGVMVWELLGELSWPVDRPCAEALAAAILTDTGWLRFSSTDPRALRAVAGLVERGARPDALYRRLYQNDRPERLRLLTRMLDSLEWHCGGRLAVLTIRDADFEETGALPEETENLVNEPFRVGSVQAVVLLSEMPDCVRASLRSRDRVDVAAVAQAFGGGGHARAAGLRAQTDLETLKDRLVAAFKKVL